MSSDYNKPSGTSTKASFPQEIRDNIIDNSILHDGAPTTANLPTNAKRLDNATGEMFNWNGSSWDSIGFISLTRDPVGDLVDGAPATLDTLNEIAAAIADDDNYATTVTNALATKLVKTSNLSDLSNAATARNNLDVYSKSEADSRYGSTVVLYCSPTATGDGSGSDASNRMSASVLASTLRDGASHYDLFLAAGDYGASVYGPLVSNTSQYRGALKGKDLYIYLQGNVTFSRLNPVNCNIRFLSDSTSVIYDLTIDDEFRPIGSNISFVDRYPSENLAYNLYPDNELSSIKPVKVLYTGTGSISFSNGCEMFFDELSAGGEDIYVIENSKMYARLALASVDDLIVKENSRVHLATASTITGSLNAHFNSIIRCRGNMVVNRIDATVSSSIYITGTCDIAGHGGTYDCSDASFIRASSYLTAGTPPADGTSHVVT